MKKLLTDPRRAGAVRLRRPGSPQARPGNDRGRQRRAGPRAPRRGDEGQPERRRDPQLLPAPQGRGGAALPADGRQRARRRRLRPGRGRPTSARCASTRRTPTPRPAFRPWRASAPAQALVREADEAMKRGDTQSALAKAQEVLKHNPTQRDARAIVRKVEEQKVKADAHQPAARRGAEEHHHHRAARRAGAHRVRADLQAQRPELRLRPRRAGRRARHGVRARHHDRGSDPLRAGDQPARAPRAQPEHRAHLPEHAGQGAGLPRAHGEELLPRQRRREADRATWCAAW